jgi:cysteinyl-tRNA synthetase
MRIFNTLSGLKEIFQPQSNEINMYVCGITPYDDAHIGHAMSYVVFDVIIRYLKFRGYKVKYVQNITDIDDKIIDRANQSGITVRELADKYTKGFLEDMEALNVSRADIYPKVTEEIPKILEIVNGLINKGHAYNVGGSVYFRVSSDLDYGKLSQRSLDTMIAGARVESSNEKEHPMDFVLWKAAKPGEPSWESPWGLGRPGWHIECSAITLKYLGDNLDIHGGGQDLIFPHHENEIAQSENFTGKKPFVKYWLHNGLLQLGEEKMSKSLGNLITIKEALSKYSADALRIFILGSHYRSPLAFSQKALTAAERGAERLRRVINDDNRQKTVSKSGLSSTYRQQFMAAMDDDFNTAQALAVIFDLVREINRKKKTENEKQEMKLVLRELVEVLGLKLEAKKMSALQAEPFIGLLSSTRNELREIKQYQLADEIRTKLDEMGVILEDTEAGTIWRRKS